MIPAQPGSTLFPYTTLFRSSLAHTPLFQAMLTFQSSSRDALSLPGLNVRSLGTESITAKFDLDRKSTRLNSSHLGTSYAVFCLKKKTRVNRMHGSGRYTLGS